MMKLNPKGGIPWIRWVIYVKLASSGKNPDGSYTRRIFSPEWERAADLVRAR